MKKIFILFAMLVAFASFAKADPIEVSCYGGVRSQFYSGDNDLYIAMASTDGNYEFYFDIVCAQGATDIVEGQTYTLSDMLSSYSCLVDYTTNVSGEPVNYTTVSLVRTNGDYDVNVTDEYGRQFHITTSAPGAITVYNDTIDLLMDNGRANKATDLTATQGVFQLIGADAANQYMMYLAVNSSQFAGTYTNDDINIQYTSMYVNSARKAVNSVGDFTVTGDATACSTYVEIVTADSILYRITYSFPGIVPAPVDTVDIVMNSASNEIADYTSSMGLFQLIGADQNDEYEMYLAVLADQIAGTYTQADVEMQYTGFYHNSSSIGVAEIRDFTVTGNAKSCSTYVEMISADNILYRINYSYTKPVIVPTDTVNITMDNAEINTVTDATKSQGLFQLIGADQGDEYEMYLTVLADQIAGTYTQDDVYGYYTGLYYDDSSIEIDEIRDFTVTGNAKSCSTYVEIVSTDAVLYRITYSYTYVPLETKDTIDITMDNENLNIVYDQTAAIGMLQLMGADSNDEYRMRMVIYSDQVAGNYTQSEVEMYYSYLDHCLPGDTNSIEIEEIRDFTVAGDEYDCNAYIEIISTDSVLYRITYTYSYGIKDTVDIVMDSKNNRVYDVTATDGYFMLVGADQAGEYAMALIVVSDQIAGTYGAADIYGVELASISGTDTTYITLKRASAFTVEGDTTYCKTNLTFLSEDSVMYRIAFEYGEKSSVENTVEETEFVVCSENNTIVVYGVEGQMMAVYDMAGRTIMNGKSTSDIKRIDVAVPGIYVVRVADKAVKVVVK